MRGLPIPMYVVPVFWNLAHSIRTCLVLMFISRTLGCYNTHFALTDDVPSGALCYSVTDPLDRYSLK